MQTETQTKTTNGNGPTIAESKGAIAPRRSVLLDMAARFDMEPAAFEATLRATVIPSGCTREQFAAFLLVARDYQLNPLTREIYAFASRGGGIMPIVGIDGWLAIANRRPEFDGLEFKDHHEDGRLVAVTAVLYRKDRAKPTAVTEYMTECVRNSDPWKQWPARMLRHKATIQAIRYGFAISGIMDDDDFERANMIDVTPPPRPTRAQYQQPEEPARPATEADERAADRMMAQAQSGEAAQADDGDYALPFPTKTNGEPDLDAYTRAFNEELKLVSQIEHVAALLEREAPNFEKLTPGRRNSLTLAAQQRQAALKGEAA